MKFFLIHLLSILLAVNPALAQVIEGKQAQNVLAPTNYVRNALAEKAESTADIVDASNILTVSSSSPIEGKKSFNIDATTTAEVIKFINDPIQQVIVGQNCEANFSYFGDASLYKAYVEQGGNKLTYTEQTLLNTGSITQVYRVNFPCGSSIAANNIVIESTGNGAAIKADKFYAGEATNITNQAVTTEPQDYTPSGSWTTNTTYTGKWHRVGPYLHYRIKVTLAGAPNAASLTIQYLPSGMLVDTAKLLSTATDGTVNIGQGTVKASGSVFDAAVYYNGTSNAAIVVKGSAAAYTGITSNINNSVPSTFVNGDSIEVWGAVPIVGWSATQSAITQQCIQDGSCENTFSAFVSSAGVVSGENIDFINGNCSIASTSYFTCNFKSSFFAATPNCSVTQTDGIRLATITSLSSSAVVVRTFDDTGANEARAWNIICQRSSTDYKPRFSAPVLVGSVTSDSTSAWRVVSVTVGSGTACTASPCNIFNADGVSSVTRASVGSYIVNITTAFSATPTCWMAPTTYAGANVPVGFVNYNGSTATAWNVQSWTAAQIATDIGFTFFCIGRR